MESNFDLDVNNYSTDDLMNFFKLDNSYSLENLIEKETKMITDLLSKDNSRYTAKYKFDIINFIKSAKEILISFKHDLETSNEIKKNINKSLNKGKDPNVGRIITPLGTHQVLETHVNPPDDIDGYNYETTTSVYVFNTAARNDFLITTASYSIFDLPVTWNNVIDISLTAANIPNVMYAFNKEAGTNQLYIEEEGTGLSGIVTLPEGNYVPYSLGGLLAVLPIQQASFPDVLSASINAKLGTGDRFKVVFDPSNYQMTISNTSYGFSMSTIVKEPFDLCSKYSDEINNDSERNKNIFNKKDVSLLQYVQTMGYLMGYREVYYSGQKSYTSESVFINKYSDYIYFALDDFTGSQTTSNTFGIIGKDTVSQSILGVIPLNSGVFTTTFDNNANFIYKKREYFGPVDISRIAIKLLNQKGNLINLHGTDFSFAIQVRSIYNLSKKSNIKLRGSGPF